MGMLFISHSSKDDELATQLRTLLREREFEAIFLDIDMEDGIGNGERWQETLYRKLRSCVALVAIVTDPWLNSHWCFAEVALARMQGKLLFGLRAAPLSPGAALPALINDHQFHDATADFEGAVERLVRGLEREGLRGSRAWNRGRSPYPGLLPFTEADAGVFFGRDEEIDRGLEVLRGSVRGTAARMTLMLGASGSGKSSLLGAGLVPRLRGEEGLLLVGPFKPGPDPLDQLASWTANAFGDAARYSALAGELRGAGASLGRLTRRLLRERGGDDSTPVLFMVDQFEELLGRPEGHDSHAFLGLMRDAVTEQDGRLSFVGTLRSDQLGALQAHPAASRLEWQTISVGPLAEHDLREVIEEPARLAELRLEQGLVDLMVADTPSPYALPLLAVTLRRLWEHYGEDGLLEIEEYKSLGGVSGSVASEAKDALASFRDEAQLDALRSALLMLVRIDENDNLVRQPARWGDTPAAARPLLDSLVRRHLLVRDGDEVQVAHEALFTAWDKLKDWIAEDREALVVRQRLAQAARLWEESGDESDLWDGPRLGRALELWEAGRLSPGAAESAFLSASRSHRDAAAEEKERRERERERLSRVALGRGLAYQALGEAEGRPQRGLLLAAEAAAITLDAGLKVTAAAESALRELLARGVGERVAKLDSGVRCLSVGDGGRLLAVGCKDGTVSLLKTDGGGTTRKSWSAAPVALVEVTLEGDLLFTRAADGALRAWETRRDDPGESYVEYLPAVTEKTLTAWAVSRGGGLVATARDGGAVVLREVGSGETWSLSPGHGDTQALEIGGTQSLSFSPTGRWLADGRENGHLGLWDLSTLRNEQVAVIGLSAPGGKVIRLAWAESEACLVTSGKYGSVHRWSLEKPEYSRSTELPSSGSPVHDLRVSPKGDVVVAGTSNYEALCWMADDKFASPVRLTGHNSSVDSVAIHPSGRFIVTSSPRDNFALLWPTGGLRSDRRPFMLKGEDAWLEVVAFTPDGAVVAGTYDGAVRRWARASDEPTEVPIPGVDLNSHALSRDGGRLISAGARLRVGDDPIDKRAKLVHFKEERVEVIEVPPTAVAVTMTPDGRLVVIVAEDGRVLVRDLSSRAELRLSCAPQGLSPRLAVDPSGRWLVLDSGRGPVLFDLEPGASNPPGRRLEVHRSRLRCVAFDEGGERLLTGDIEGVLALWRRRGGGYEVARTLTHEGAFWCAFRPRPKGWVSGSSGSLLVAGEADDAAPLRLDIGFTSEAEKFALSGGGSRVAAASSVQVTSWNLGAEAPAETRLDLPQHEGQVMALAVSEGGGRIATAMLDGPVRLWDTEDLSNPVSLPKRPDAPSLLAFVDGDRRLITAAQNGSLAAWDLDVQSLVARARRLAGRELTPEERARFLSL